MHNYIFKCPSNIELWKRLIELQKLVLGTSSKKQKEASARSLGEKCMGIYEKAITRNQDSIELIVEYLKCCEDIKDYIEILNMWSKYLKKYPESLELRLHYLKFRQTQHQSFSFSSYMKEFESCVSLYNRMYCEEKIHEAEENLMIHMFSRTCRVVFESGYDTAILCSFTHSVPLH